MLGRGTAVVAELQQRLVVEMGRCAPVLQPWGGQRGDSDLWRAGTSKPTASADEEERNRMRMSDCARLCPLFFFSFLFR